MIGARQRKSEFIVVTMKTNEGIEGTSFGFAARGAEIAGYIVYSALQTFFGGRNLLARVKDWQEIRAHNRWLSRALIYATVLTTGIS